MAFISMTFELENKKRCRSLSDQHLLARFHPKNPIITKPYVHEDIAVAFENVKRDNDYAIKLGWTHIIIARLIREIEFEQVQQLPVQDLSKKLMEYLATHFTEPITLMLVKKLEIL